MPRSASASENEHTGNRAAIGLNQRVSEEFYRYGKQYYDEAVRIVTNMPRLPSKFSEADVEKMVTSPREGSRVTSDQMMQELKQYINRLIRFSPLIRNLFYWRDFLLCNRSGLKDQITPRNQTNLQVPGSKISRGLDSAVSQQLEHVEMSTWSGKPQDPLMVTSLNETQEVDEAENAGAFGGDGD